MHLPAHAIIFVAGLWHKSLPPNQRDQEHDRVSATYAILTRSLSSVLASQPSPKFVELPSLLGLSHNELFFRYTNLMARLDLPPVQRSELLAFLCYGPWSMCPPRLVFRGGHVSQSIGFIRTVEEAQPIEDYERVPRFWAKMLGIPTQTTKSEIRYLIQDGAVSWLAARVITSAPKLIRSAGKPSMCSMKLWHFWEILSLR